MSVRLVSTQRAQDPVCPGCVGLEGLGWRRALEPLPLAVALGWIAQRHGVAFCMIAYAVFDLLNLAPDFASRSG